MIYKFHLPFYAITGNKPGVTSYADGSGGPGNALRTSPLASELPLTCEALPFASAALPLTCRAAPVNSSTFAALTTPEGLRSLRSASSLSFLVILLPQNNSLTFVRGADRAYCAPRKWQIGLSSLPTDQSLPMPDATRPPGGALACAPGSDTLPLTPRNLEPADVQLLFFGCPPPDNAGKSIQRFHAPSVPR